MPPEDMGGPRLEDTAGGQGQLLFGKCALAPIDPAVYAEVGTVQIIRAAGQGTWVEPNLTLIGHTVVVRVGQFPDRGRRRHVE